MEKGIRKKGFGAGVLVLLLTATLTTVLYTKIGYAEEQNPNEIHLSYHFTEPWITQVNISNTTYDRVIINGTQLYCQNGTPCLPINPVSVLLPQQGEFQSITVDYEGNISIGENYNVQLGTNFVTVNRIEEQNQSQYYNSSRPYPTTVYTNCGVHYFRGYSILIFSLHPVYYIGSSGEIYYYQWMNVTITTSSTGSVNPLFRNLPKDEQQMKQMVDDYNRSSTYTSDPDNPPPSYLVDPTKMYEYVIITTSDLKNSQGEHTFQDLMNYKNARGITTTIVTVDDIYNAYAGLDNQDKIRNFIRDAYSYWDTKYVLLGGDNNDTGYGTVPARYLWVAVTDPNGNEIPQYSKNIPADIYYACLDGPYNYQVNEKWGEPHDGDGGGDVDLIAEVHIGRACVDNPTELSNFVMKTLAYENTADPYLENVLMVGEYLGFGGEADWGGNFKDEIIDGSQYPYITTGIPSDQYLIETLYDEDYQPNGWPNSLLIDYINDNTHIINHLGHGQNDQNMKLHPSDINSLTNEKYCFIYSQACHSGSFDNPVGYDCIAEHLTVKTSHGAFAGIWNSRYGWEGGFEDEVDGPSHRHDRWFFDGIYNASQKDSVMRELAGANQYSKWKNLYLVDETESQTSELPLHRICRWVCYELNLFGDPQVAIKSDYDLEVTNIDLPRFVQTGSSIPVKASIWNRGLNDETNVGVNFIVNGNTVDSDVIDISHIEATNVTFSYTFSHGISYDLSIETEIVVGEEITSNNWLNRTVVGDYPPDKPETPTGPPELKKNIEGTFSTSTTDSDDDQVYYWWDWGDGSFSDWIGPNINQATHSWETKGDYSVRVIAKDEHGGISSWSDPMPLTVPLDLDITTQQTTLLLGQTAMFFSILYDAVTPCDFLWAFGDSSASYTQNTTHIYYTPGNYAVILNVTDNESDWGTATINITIVPIIAEFTATPTEYAQTNEVISFNDTSEGYYSIVNWTWNFDDGTFSYNKNTTHIYTKDGVYNISLTIRDDQSNNDTYYQTLLIDSIAPEINTILATPHTVGFGYNITITANVSDLPTNHCSGLNAVSLNITYPDETYLNSSMEKKDPYSYFYEYNDTWLIGQYNCTIWARDNSSNNNCSGMFHFHVSSLATISIATLKDSYGGTDSINITDPPNPIENLTLVARGQTWNEFYNATSGNNVLEAYVGPVNYQENNGTWMPINETFDQLSNNHPVFNYGYRVGNNRGPYGAYFKPNIQDTWPVAFTYNRADNTTTDVIRTKLVGVGYVDPQSNWAYHYLQNVQNSQGQINDNSITYEDVFTGTDVSWTYANTGLKEEIILSNTTKTILQNHPPSQFGLHDASSYLVFITKLDYQNLHMFNTSGILTGNVTISDVGVDFKDALGYFKCALPLGEAYELNDESIRQKLTYRIVHLNGDIYLLSGLKVSKLNTMTFPVVVDPTLTVYSTTSDGYIHKSSTTSYNTAWTASSGTVYSSVQYLSIGQKKGTRSPPDYNVYRGFVFFNTSTLPSNAVLDNATLSIYKKDDYSTTDFNIIIQNGQPTYPHDPMQTGDYNKSCYSGNGGSLNTSSFTNGYNQISLNNLTWINATGTTKLCLRSSRDISGLAPAGNEYVNVHSSEFLGMCPAKLSIAYRNQSKIKNTGSTNMKGYLLIQVQYLDTGQFPSQWVVDNDTVNESTIRTITQGQQLGLDTIFNGLIRASELTHGAGTYRVYAALRDPEGNILQTNSGAELKAWWQFSKA